MIWSSPPKHYHHPEEGTFIVKTTRTYKDLEITESMTRTNHVDFIQKFSNKEDKEMFENEKRIKGIIYDMLGCEEDDVTNEAILTKDLGAVSLDALEIIMEIEEIFDINVEYEDFSKDTTVKDIIDYVNELV